MSLPDVPIGQDLAMTHGMRSADEVEAMARLKAANAKNAETWFEIWQEVTEAGVYFMVKGRADAETAYERLRDRRAIYKRIKREFVAIELDMTEKFLLSGMDQKPDGTWYMKGNVIKIALKTRNEVVTFKGEDAQVAFNFFTWWHAFKQSANPLSVPGPAHGGLLH